MTKTARYIAWVGAVMVLLVAGLIGARHWTTPACEAPDIIPQKATPPGTPRVIALTIDYVPFSEIDYSRWSRHIVIGTIEKVLPAIWDDCKRYVYTPVLVSVERQIKGPAPVKELTMHLIGGTVGDTTLYVSDMKIPDLGTRYFLFLGDMHKQKREKLVPVADQFGMVRLEGGFAFPRRPPHKPEPADQFIANVEAAMRGEFFPTPTPTWVTPTPFPPGYWPKPAGPG